MSAFLNGFGFGIAQGMFSNMFRLGGFGMFGGFMGNPFGCFCMPSFFNMSSLFMTPRLNFSNMHEYTTIMPQMNFTAQSYNISPLDFSAPNLQGFDNIQIQPSVIDTQNYTPIGDTFTKEKEKEKETVKTRTETSIPNNEKKYDDLIIKYANKYNVEVAFIRAIIKKESSFNPNATSKAGAMGLMQLMPATFDKICKKYDISGDVYDPETNIKAGVIMLSNLSEKYKGDKRMILAAYNWGMGNLAAEEEGRKKRPKETIQYIEKVMDYYNQYNQA